MEPKPNNEWKYVKETYPVNSWSLFPIVEAMAHDKALMTHHNLGTSVDKPGQLAWTLALGYTMISHVTPKNSERPEYLEWLRWTDRVQKSVIAEYIGGGLSSFSHKWGDLKDKGDDGVMKAVYGQVSIVANLGSKPVKEGSCEISPDGFFAKGPGFSAGNLVSLGGVQAPDGSSFVVARDGQGMAAWLYGKPGSLAVFPLPEGFGTARAKLDDGTEIKLETKGQTASVKLPSGEGSYNRLWKLSLSR